MFLWIHVQSEDFFFLISYFSVNGYFESEEKVAALPTNPQGNLV